MQLPEGQTIVSSVLQDPQRVSRCPLCVMCPQDVVLPEQRELSFIANAACHVLCYLVYPSPLPEPSVMVGKKAGVC